MIRTSFAGLTQLDPSEPITTDGSSFQSRNPAIIDRFLQVGAVTHHHDGHAALTDPALTPSGSVSPSGGAIPGDTPIYIGYTLTDASGGETAISPVILLTTAPPYTQPQTLPVASADYTGGSLLANTYWYCLTLTDGQGGETPPGPIVTVTRAPGYASGQTKFSGLTADFAANNAAAWRLYRALPGQQFGFLASGAADTYTDDGSLSTQCSINPPPPGVNTTTQQNALTVVVPSGQASGQIQQPVSFNLYVTNTGNFLSPALLATYPIASAGVPITFPQLAVSGGSPPPVSTCIPGANQIDPDTDILQWTWKRPVPTFAMLPGSAAAGDVRLVLDRGLPYVCSAGASANAVWQSMDPPVTGDTGAVLFPDGLQFVGSGGATVAVTRSPAGSAVVTITAGGGGAGTQGPAGPPGAPGGGSANLGVSPTGGSATGVLVSPTTAIEFAGSGAAQVSVASAGGGSAIVTITALPSVGPAGPQGIQGVQGNTGNTGPTGPAGAAGGAGGGSAASASNLYAPSGAIYISSAGTVAGSGWTTQTLEDFSTNHSNPPVGFTTLNGAAPLADQGYLYWSGAVGSNDAEVRWDAGGNVTDTMRVTGKFRAGGTNCQRMTLIAVSVGTSGQDSSLALAYFNDGTIQLSVGAVGNWGVGSTAAGPTWTQADYWMRVTRNGNVVKGEIFTADPALGAAPTATVNYTLTGADATALGTGVSGKPGVHSYFVGNADTTTRWYSLKTESLGSSPDTRHSEIRAWASGASGMPNRRLFDDQGRSDFLLDVFASGASATGTFTRDVDALVVQGSGLATITVASAVSPNVAKAPGTSAAVVTVTGVPSTGDANWTPPALGGAWATSSTAQTAGESTVGYRKDGQGFVHVIGYLDTGFAAGTPIFTLPAGYRPLKTKRFMAPTSGTVTGDASSSKAAFVTVKTDGTINWNGEGSAYIALDQIYFLAEQ